MITTEISKQTLDKILAIQFTVAWAGEGLTDPPRLKWWRTAMVEEFAGHDLFERLAPRTKDWAALEAAREAAFIVDRKARLRMANPDKVRTLFFWGFDVDEALAARLLHLKSLGRPPSKSLPLPLELGYAFDRATLENKLSISAPVQHIVQVSGRELKAELPADLGRAAEVLAAALLPFSEEYPAPFFRL